MVFGRASRGFGASRPARASYFPGNFSPPQGVISRARLMGYNEGAALGSFSASPLGLGRDGLAECFSKQVNLGDRKKDEDAGHVDERGDKRTGGDAGVDARALEDDRQHRADERTP